MEHESETPGEAPEDRVSGRAESSDAARGDGPHPGLLLDPPSGGKAVRDGLSVRQRLVAVLPLFVVLTVVGWAWAPMLGLHLTGEDYTLLARIDRGLEASPHVFRPLLGAWLSLLHDIFGVESAVPYHVGSLLLHLANTALVFALGRRLFASAWTAGAAAAVFGLGAGVRDALFWVAAVNRPLSCFGALVALNGLVRLRDRGRVPLALVVLGLAWQFVSNEDVYGTALVVGAWCLWGLWDAPARRARFLGVGGFAAALLLIHYFAIHRVPGGTEAVVGVGWEGAWVSARARSDAIAAGIGMPAAFGIVLPVLGALGLWAAARRAAAGFLMLAWLGSFVPFVLSAAVGYRFYPSQAPVALLFAGGFLAVFAKSFRWPAVLPIGFVVLLVLSLSGSRNPRTAGLARWDAALQEIRACEEPLRALAQRSPDEAPISANIETTTMGLVYYHWRSLADPSDVRFFGFLDGARGYVPPDGAPEGTWFGRRCEGSFGVIEPERYFAQREPLEKVRLYHQVEVVDSLRAARARLTDPAFDLQRVALVETAEAGGLAGSDPPFALDPEANASARLAILEPFEILVLNHSGRMKLAVDTPADVVVGLQDNWLFDPLYRIPLDQTIFSGIEEGRVYAIDATTAEGVALETFPLNGYGLGLHVPPGRHTIEVRFRKRGPTELQ